MKKNNLILGIVLSIASVSCTRDQLNSEKVDLKSKPLKVEIAEVNQRHETFVYLYSGIIEPSVITQLSFQSLGTVDQISVDEGDFVEKGQLLAQLNDKSIQSAFEAALATQKQAQDAYDRLKMVYDKGSLPAIKWEEIKTKLEQANASSEISKQNLENTKLRAPYSGVIGSRKIEIGSSANPAITAFEIVSINSLYARISVPENEISKFKKGQVGMINIAAVGAINYTAEVEKIGVMANQLSKTYSVKLRLSNVDLKIKPGMVCNCKITIPDNSKTITVPMQAVLNKPNNNLYVFVFNKNEEKVSKRPIQVGTFTNSEVQVIDGLSDGEFIVVNGQQKLVDNSKVSF